MQIETSQNLTANITQIRWEAVQKNDSTMDNSFVYGVLTTGVYCRPSCKSKQPNRENILFYDSYQAAEKAGFRPCKRCKPNSVAEFDQRVQKIEDVCRKLESTDEPINIAELAKSVGMSRFHFQRSFKKVTGITPKAYAECCRTSRIKTELNSGESILGAIFGSGYNSSSRFYEKSNQILGMKPSQYKEGGRGSQIKFAIGKCTFGDILVAATNLGICAIDLGDDPNLLIRDFQSRFAEAELLGGDADFELLVAKVVGFVDNPKSSLDLPLDIRGTVFQRRVWEELSKIPFGTKVSYSQISQRIGQPRAVRAVANACGKNTMAVAIPCHRVVRTDGSIGGYRWGVERKIDLLAKEADIGN